MTELRRDIRPRWAWLLFPQLALLIGATVLATAGRFPAAVFRAPIDKLGHFFGYGGLALFALAFFGPRRRWWVIAMLLLAATLEEISQRAFPTRTFDLMDLAANWLSILTALGASRGLLFPRFFLRWLKRSVARDRAAATPAACPPKEVSR